MPGKRKAPDKRRRSGKRAQVYMTMRHYQVFWHILFITIYYSFFLNQSNPGYRQRFWKEKLKRKVYQYLLH
jgi:hypothetical protein